MAEVVDAAQRWAALRKQLWDFSVKREQPKKKADWFMLRERWYAYTDRMREMVLCLAEIDEHKLLEAYTTAEKYAIATVICEMLSFADHDRALISREKARLKRLHEPDE